MLKYLVVMLEDTAVSYCHYPQRQGERRLMPIETLTKAIRYGMLENLMIQFVYPDYELPEEYNLLIETIDHVKIKPAGLKNGDVTIVNGIEGLNALGNVDILVAVRLTYAELLCSGDAIIDALRKAPRVNVVITDTESLDAETQESYRKWLYELADEVARLYREGLSPQLNLLTDRMMLDGMNNCNAGWESITVAPNGAFYPCPAFYLDGTEPCGTLSEGVSVKNSQLYRLDHAPICRNCDAYHCRRCAWLNLKTTLEVNTPSREQCVSAHLERNASRELLAKIRKTSALLPGTEISEIDYLDPFDKLQK